MTGQTGELVVVSGRYRGHRIPLAQPVLRIGRDRTCDVLVDDEAASRIHSEIIREDGKLLVRDLHSTNGTFVNDERITEQALQNGDRIGVGDTVLLLQLDPLHDQMTPQVIFSKEQRSVSASVSLSLNDTRFLELNEGSTVSDAQRQFTQLYAFMNDISGILHPPALLERALGHFLKDFGADRGLVLLLTPDGQPGLQIAKVRDGVVHKDKISISRTMAQQLLQKKESFLSVNALSDERLAASESLANMRVYSIIGAPLKVKDKVIGLVYLDTVAGGKPFTEQDLKLCTAMSIQLALCIENTRLYNELLDAAEFNNSVLRSLASGIIVIDANGCVVRINQATFDILEKDEASLIGRKLDEFPELNELNRIIQSTLSSGQSEDRHEVLIVVGSQVVPLGLSTSVLTDHARRVVGVVANFRNLTPIRKLEEQVRRSQHLAALGQMAAGVAHEIRNPLNSIRGFAQLLHELAAKDPTQTEYAQIILEEVDRMNRIVQDLLDFSRQRDLTLAPVQVLMLMQDLVKEMQNDAQQAGVTLEIANSDEVFGNVLGNYDKLRQVFRNILLNAIQACQKGGRVTVSAKQVESQVPNPNEKQGPLMRRDVAISVEDNGVGIDTAIMSKIFDPFFTQKDKGTGLGLSISQKIVGQHGGRIDVKSLPGKGSTFIVCLPAV